MATSLFFSRSNLLKYLLILGCASIASFLNINNGFLRWGDTVDSIAIAHLFIGALVAGFAAFFTHSLLATDSLTGNPILRRGRLEIFTSLALRLACADAIIAFAAFAPLLLLTSLHAEGFILSNGLLLIALSAYTFALSFLGSVIGFAFSGANQIILICTTTLATFLIPAFIATIGWTKLVPVRIETGEFITPTQAGTSLSMVLGCLLLCGILWVSLAKVAAKVPTAPRLIRGIPLVCALLALFGMGYLIPSPKAPSYHQFVDTCTTVEEGTTICLSDQNEPARAEIEGAVVSINKKFGSAAYQIPTRIIDSTSATSFQAGENTLDIKQISRDTPATAALRRAEVLSGVRTCSANQVDNFSSLFADDLYKWLQYNDESEIQSYGYTADRIGSAGTNEGEGESLNMPSFFDLDEAKAQEILSAHWSEIINCQGNHEWLG